jgi:glycosyltransferase involved in cell wall biosynthesis
VSSAGTHGAGAGCVDVTIASGGHDVADARLHRIANALVRAGLRVQVMGLGDAAGAPDGASVLSHPRGGMRRRLLDAVVMPWRAGGRVLLVIAPEMVPNAAMACRLRRRRLVVDVYEDYAALAHDREFSSLARRLAVALVRVAMWFAARADITTVADEHVPPRTARRRMVLRNLPDRTRLPSPVQPDGAPRAVYIGDVRRSRGLQVMAEALELAPDWMLDIVGPVSVADEGWLQDWLQRSPAAGRLRMHGRQPPDAAWRIAAGGWVGLSLLADTPAFRAAVPSKLYEYFAVGLPVLASPLPRVRAIVEQAGAGLIVSTPQEVASALQLWSSDRDSLATCRQAALRWASDHLPAVSPYDDLAAQVAQLAEK